MVNNRDENENSEKRTIESEIGASPCCAGGAESSNFSGGDMKQMMQGCPWACRWWDPIGVSRD